MPHAALGLALAAAVVLTSCGGSTGGQATQAELDALAQRVAALEARLAEMPADDATLEAAALDELKKRAYIDTYLPHVGIALQEILGLSEKQKDDTVGKLREVLEHTRKIV